MNELVLGADEALVVPCVGGPAVFDMREILKARARLVELQSVTPVKAGELIHAFIKAWSLATEYAIRAKSELLRAKARMRETRAIVILDKVPDELKRLGMSSARSPAGSEDLRNSVVDRDPDFRAAEDRVIRITAAMEMMEKDAAVFKMAYFAVDKTLGPRREVSGDSGSDDIGALTEQERTEAFVREHSGVKEASYVATGFGAPKY